MAEIEKHASDNISRVLVGSRCDRESERAVSFEEGKELADNFNVRFMEVSATSGQNCE